MAGDVTFVEGPLKFMLEFAEVDAMDLGVQGRIEVGYAGQGQRLQWTVGHRWFDYEALLRFEEELRDGDDARLLDMSMYPVLHFRRDSSQEYLTINPHSQRQSHGGDCMAICLKIHAGSMHALYAAFSQFGRWW